MLRHWAISNVLTRAPLQTLALWSCFRSVAAVHPPHKTLLEWCDELSRCPRHGNGVTHPVVRHYVDRVKEMDRQWCAHPEALHREQTKEMLPIVLQCLCNVLRAGVSAQVCRRSQRDHDALISRELRSALENWMTSCGANVETDAASCIYVCGCLLNIGSPSLRRCFLRRACTPSVIRSLSSEELVELLHCISVDFDRHPSPLPDLSSLILRITQAAASSENGCSLSSHDILRVLTALVRLKEKRFWDTVRLLEQRAQKDVASYTPLDLAFAMRACVFLPHTSEGYVSAVLTRCTVVAPSMNGPNLGAVCHYLLRLKFEAGTKLLISSSCAPQVRRLLPAILQRTQLLLGTLSLRDAKNVLACFNAFGVRHSIVFAQLTPFVESNVLSVH